MAGLLIPAKKAGEIAGRFDRGLPVYSTVFYPNFGCVLEYKITLRSFKSSEHINGKGDGPYHGFS